jgi:hypothetical protein
MGIHQPSPYRGSILPEGAGCELSPMGLPPATGDLPSGSRDPYLILATPGGGEAEAATQSKVKYVRMSRPRRP